MLGIENYTCSKRGQEQDENAGPSIQKTRAFTAGLPMPDAVVAALQEARRNLGGPPFLPGKGRSLHNPQALLRFAVADFLELPPLPGVINRAPLGAGRRRFSLSGDFAGLFIC